MLGVALLASLLSRAATWTSPNGVVLAYEEAGGGAEITECSLSEGFSGGLEIPSRLGSLPVRSIEGRAFAGCSGLTSVSIPAGVTDIGYRAFSGCSGVTSVTIPKGVTNIKGKAFSGCYGLTSVAIPEGVTSKYMI